MKIVRVANVDLTGGIIGLLGDSPQTKLNKAVTFYSKKGWRVQQILPAAFPNVLLILLRIVILLITLGFYTTSSGYYLVIEKEAEETTIG